MLNAMPRGADGMVATPHYLASSVGFSIIQEGGNAFDAAVAVSAVLAVVYPHMTGLGGDAFFLMYPAQEGKVIGYNGSGGAAGLATRERFAALGHQSIPQRGPLSAITVPGMVDAWWEVWSRYGRLPWARLLQPAIAYAEGGFPVSRNLAYWIAKDERLIRADRSLAKLWVAKGGQLLGEGERAVLPELAASLQQVSAQGRRAFYEGELMRAIVRSVHESGGFLREDDFVDHHGEWVEPVGVDYRGYRIMQMPPNSQGVSLLLMMNMLENMDVSALPRSSDAFFHVMTEVIKAAFQDRDLYVTDPKFHPAPLDELLSKEYAAQKWAKLDLFGKGAHAAPVTSMAMGQDTAYAAVVDREGNAVSFIQSLYFDFGSAYSAGGTGIVLQNRGSFFSLDPLHPNTLEPHKRSFHTLMPGMVLKSGKPYLLCGTQGGEGQPQTSLSLLTAVLDYGCSVQEAIGLPRWVYGRTWGEDADELKLENRLPLETLVRLRRRGHRVETVAEWDGVMGQAQAILIEDNGMLSGAADPRGDGMAIGW
ncbi:gamma-glutamyltransferase [Paenibacillus turpanensis]|uniref:gamma-glutamyltransferase n=1 Tax=Paenibacillus turpanensis TaxID=2689078 RepID=UPI00140D7C80|nr:gamma-glutamyltransferase [Paenibacillus turpanensis]